MKTFMLLWAALACLGATHSATLQSGEWFLDTDPGEGSGTPISGVAGSSADLDVTIPAGIINALDKGTHLLGLRLQDSGGAWSQTAWRVFVNRHPHGGLATGEYFFNQDPGMGSGTALSGVAGMVAPGRT